MRPTQFVLLTLLIAGSCTQRLPEQLTEQSEHSFNYLRENFRDPPIEFSTSPFWVWNDEVTPEKIDRQLEAFKAENIDQVIIHPRMGLITEYLSAEYIDLHDYALERARELDMNLWLYDENSFPSGFAGGHVQADMPASYEGGTGLQMISGSAIAEFPAEDYAAILRKSDSGYDIVSEMPANPDESFVAFRIAHEAPNGWYGGFPYVDLLVPGVTEKFIEVTMKGYQQKFGEAFGQRVKGIFTDEPNISQRTGNGNLRYTPTLFADFETMWGYDLKPHLVSLFNDTGNYKEVRYHYYRLLLELFIERWSKPWFQYSKEHELTWTGHYWEHGWPNPQHGGDNMAMYAWHQMPGIDMLFNTFDLRPDQFGNVRAVKELRSAANQTGRQRTLSETYGASGWELRFEDMKRLGDWQYVLGVNFMNQHLAFMTLKGRRKGDFPQSLLTHAPYWDDYGVLAQYFKRLSLALSLGDQLNSTVIIEPTTSAWMHYIPDGDNEKLTSIEQQFRALVDGMEKYQLEYDLASENIMHDRGSVTGDRLLIGERGYSTVILPRGLENIDRETYDLLNEYVKNGGRVISFEIPQRVNGSTTNLISQLAASAGNWISTDRLDNPEILDALASPDFTVTDPSSITGNVFHQRRIFDDGQLLFWTNFSEEGEAQIKFSAQGSEVYVLDPVSGEIRHFPFEADNDQVRVTFDIPATASKLFFIADRPLNETSEMQSTEAQKFSEQIRIDPGEIEVTPTGLNTLTLDYTDIRVGNMQENDLYFSMAADSAYKLNGLEVYGRTGYDPWAVAIQYRTNILDMADSFDLNSGATATYHFTIASENVPEELQAVVEWAHLYDIRVNGTPVTANGNSWLDHSFDIIDLTPYARPGDNTIELSVYPMHIHAEIEPVYLRGLFNVTYADKGFELTAYDPPELGSWKDQGWMFYPEGMRYTTILEHQPDASYQLRLREWSGTVARVIVNEMQVGIIGWQPYTFDLTPYLTGRSSQVSVEVVGSLKNLLGPHHGNIRPGIVTPWSWFYAPEHQPAGREYDFLDYGLMEPFEIMRSQHSEKNTTVIN